MVKSLHGIPQGHSLKLKDLAAALGISAPMVSRLVKRGMPTELDAARRWRKRHLNPLQTKDARIGGLQGQRFGGAPAPRVEHAQLQPAVDAANAVRHAQGLADLAADLLAHGRFESVEPLMRAALRAVPPDMRAEVEMPTDVWTALTADALRVCRKFDAEAGASSEPLDALTDDEADVLGPFWYAVAAGEFVPSAGPAEG